jgi:hypothetical protein
MQHKNSSGLIQLTMLFSSNDIKHNNTDIYMFFRQWLDYSVHLHHMWENIN